MLLMVEKGIRRRICHSSYQYAKANSTYIHIIYMDEKYRKSFQ